MNNVFSILQQLRISYEEHKHPAVFTVAEAETLKLKIEGAHNKNLFLRNRTGDKYYLVIIIGSKRLDLKELASFLKETKLSFASSEELFKYLKLTPGSVSPFGLINDAEKTVQVIVDEDLLSFNKQGFHPNINTSTLVISTDNFKKFLEWTDNRVIYRKL